MIQRTAATLLLLLSGALYAQQQEVLTLDEAIPQIEVPQAGETYLMPRDVEINGTLTNNGQIYPSADGSVGQTLTTDGAGNLSWSTAAGSGDVLKVGTPVNDQVGVWTGDGSIEGDVDLTFDGSNLTITGNVSVAGTTFTGADAGADVVYGWDDTAGQYENLTGAEVRAAINVEDGADVTDTANVTSAGALMDSEVDADIQTLSLPASTTISAFGATLVDDAAASNARTTLGVDAAGTDNSTDVTLAGTPDYITISGQEITRNQIVLTTDVSGELPDANVADNITASSYLPLAGGTMTGSLVTDNLGIEFADSDTNPSCSAGEYKIYADLSETVLKKCMNGTATDLDTGAAGGDAWSDVVDAVITPDADGTRDLATTGTRFATGYLDAIDITNNIVVGGTVDGRDVAADGTELDSFDDDLATLTLAASSTVSGSNTGDEAVSSVTVSGVVELATTAETTTGTDATRAVTPDGLEDGYDGSTNVVTLGTITTGVWNGTSIADANVDDTITASNYLPLAGGTMTGSLVTDNLGVEFTESDTNPTCGAGEYKIYADLSETTLKKCLNGSASNLDTTGGSPSFDGISGGTNTSAAMVVGTGASMAVSGSGTIAATSVSTITGLAPDTATTAAAQPNITSLGTLTTLTVDNVTINGSDISHATAADMTMTATAGNSVVIESVDFDGGVVTGATIGTSNTVTINASDITDQNAGTDVTADLEEEAQVGTTAITGNAVDNSVLVGTGVNAAGYVTLPSCAGESNTLGYDTATGLFECNTDAGGFTDIDTDYGNELVTAAWSFEPVNTGAFGSYDLQIGDDAPEGHGGIQLGDAGIYNSSYVSGSVDLGNTMVFRNEGTPDGTPGIEFAFVESASNTIRLAIPESGAGNAMNAMRSLIVGTGDGSNNNDMLCATHTTYDSNIDCNTGTSGGDLLVQDDTEVLGSIYAHEGIYLDPDDVNQLHITAASQTAAHTLSFPDDELTTGDVMTGGASGAVVYSAWDADVLTLDLPASTTISATGASLIDDASTTAMLTTLGLDNDLATATVGASATLTGSNTGDQDVSLNTKEICLQDPATGDTSLFFIFHNYEAITIAETESFITGTTNVVWNIGHAATRTGTQLDVFSSDITLTSTAGQNNASGFNDATVPADSYIWLEVVSISGTPTSICVSLRYTVD